MPNEALIIELETILNQVINLGAQTENSKIVPNLNVTDANPSDLDDFVIVSDDRDGDNILAKKVPSVIYSDADKVNVIFTKGGEAIAFQQGSQSASGAIWSIVPGTSTDIFYNSGDVGIGKSVAPDAKLELLDTTQAQLRLTYTEDTKFADFTLDTNHDLTIKPSSTGQVILQPTTDSTGFFHVLDADGGDPALQVNTVENTASINTSDISFVAAGTTTKTGLFISNPDSSNFHGFTLSKSSDNVNRHTAVSILRASASGGAVSDGWLVASILFAGHDGTDYNFNSGIRAVVEGAVSANTVPGRLQFLTTTTNSPVSRVNIDPGGTVKIGPEGTPSGQLHIDQSDGSGGIPALFIDQGDTSQAVITVSSNGSDQDITILEVNVGGTPTNIWDESLDAFSWNKALNVTAGNSTFGWSTDNLRLSVADTGTNASQLTPTEFLPSGNAISESAFGIVNENAAGNIVGMAWQVRSSSVAGAFLSLERTANFQGDMVLQIRDASGTAPEIMRWRHNGNVSIGPTTPTARLHVDQDVSGGGNAVPVILLDQSDLSEEFINFVTSVGAGNPIDTAAIGTYYGKARVAVNGTFKYVALYNS